ncbi:GNAT family N-acetyltransferase [Flavobacterium solisilvae]|uniref:GNAT family N-acetyltransferase n=1 Tax=Flavobacterium solisilvae TaxID=1852019 RepID=A0ABX1QV53_9FLAO|nr:GNAT family N-acetyltransferase [Flavobacterium solisilvae]NMH25218.1 GNAT family N-acetyltransferase [Flavobacterium solisilvae]
MKNYTVKLYEKNDFQVWNAFIGSAKNATFLFHRDFMEYHSDRFQDYSMMVFEEGKLVSVIPANKVENTVFSHQGLTYGGFVFGEKIKLGEVITITKSVLAFLHQNEISTLQLKLIPSIYNHFFSEEIEYCLFLTEARLIRRDCLSVIDLEKPFLITKTRKESIRRGEKNNLVIKEELNFELFWNEILIPNLSKKHNAKPVHSLEEIINLQKKFPENIRHFNVYFNGEIMAGTTVFVTDNVAHPQYISGNEKKNELGSIDYLYNHLIKEVFPEKCFFDFGPSHEENGKKINQGILFWKESFGAKTTVQDYYVLETKNFVLLNDILI